MYDAIYQPTTIHPDSPADDEAWDKDFDTYYGTTHGKSGSCSVTSTHDFNATRNICSVIFKASAHSGVTNIDKYGAILNLSAYVYYWDLITSSWKVFPGVGDSVSYGQGGSEPLSFSRSLSVDQTVSVDIFTNKIYAYASASQSIRGGAGDGSGYARVYEVQVYAKTNWNSGGIIKAGQ